jgi:hypothetical protein
MAATMSAARILRPPMSGRDRRHYAAELHKAEQAHAPLASDAARAHDAADQMLAEAYRLDCLAWSALQFIGGDQDSSPTIAAALHGKCDLLEVQCRHCNHSEVIDLTLVIWPRERPVHTLRKALYCRHCMKTYGKKRRSRSVFFPRRNYLLY